MADGAWFDRLLRRQPLRGRRWPVLQVEVTSRCLLHCSFCPNKGLGENWRHGDFPWDIFRECLGPHLGRFETVYLQGWGEPLLHPRLWDMIALAKQAGAKAGFTTCGGLLSQEAVERVLDLQVDLLAISFAGASADVHEHLRVGSRFDQLVANVDRLVRSRNARGTKRPFLELHFLMQSGNMAELPEFVRLGARLGADELVATNVTYAPTREIAEMAVFGRTPDVRHVDILAEAEQEAARLNMKFRAYPLRPSEAVLECDARPCETCYVTHTGKVTPCVFLGLPTRGAIPRFFEGAHHPTPPIAYGDVRDGFLDVLQGPAHAAFCAPFRARKAAGRVPFAVLDGSDVPLPAPPEPCRSCYKLYGL